MNLFDSLRNPTLDLQCPDCATVLHLTLADLKDKKAVLCTCGNSITLDEDGPAGRKLAKAVQDFEKASKMLRLG